MWSIIRYLCEQITLGKTRTYTARFVPFSSLLIPLIGKSIPYFPALQLDITLLLILTVAGFVIAFTLTYYLISNIGAWTYTRRFHSPWNICLSVILHYAVLLLLIGIGYLLVIFQSEGLPSNRDFLAGLFIASIYLILSVQLFYRGIPESMKQNAAPVNEFIIHIHQIRDGNGTSEDAATVVTAGKGILASINEEKTAHPDAPVEELREWISAFEEHGFLGQEKMAGNLPENPLDIWQQYYNQLKVLEEYLETVRTPAHVKVIKYAHTD